jgi:hypothetical protein
LPKTLDLAGVFSKSLVGRTDQSIRLGESLESVYHLSSENGIHSVSPFRSNKKCDRRRETGGMLLAPPGEAFHTAKTEWIPFHVQSRDPETSSSRKGLTVMHRIAQGGILKDGHRPSSERLMTIRRTSYKCPNRKVGIFPSPQQTLVR